MSKVDRARGSLVGRQDRLSLTTNSEYLAWLELCTVCSLSTRAGSNSHTYNHMYSHKYSHRLHEIVALSQVCVSNV
ncbi:hypothetical protein RRG08_019845 [Elysia crispata]|uniref:Uncharacterized protein n=1 Tax=Elysia crispata TaxID=231223 RepID=A0AAE1DP72_9GAST|nr:hypothetical protein RRG08_019845 [Elysia crispata]